MSSRKTRCTVSASSLAESECICVNSLAPLCLLSLSLCSQTPNLSEAAKPPRARRGQRRRPRGRPWRIQTGKRYERWPVRGQEWDAPEQDSQYIQQEREHTYREVSEEKLWNSLQLYLFMPIFVEESTIKFGFSIKKVTML